MVAEVIIGALRIKNERRWIEKVIRSIQPVCGRIVIFDDHSDDGTPEICESLGCTVFRSEFSGIQEARDKDFLLSKVWETGAQAGDVCLMVDGDESLHPDDVVPLLAAAQSSANCWSFHIVYLWDTENQIRVDRWYREFRRPSMFRLTSQSLSFLRTPNGGNFHCSSAPSALLGQIIKAPVRLLHYGYMFREDRVRKYEFYNRIDPGNPIEDGYRHMVIGDLFPAESAFRWAGPLRLEALR